MHTDYIRINFDFRKWRKLGGEQFIVTWLVKVGIKSLEDENASTQREGYYFAINGVWTEFHWKAFHPCALNLSDSLEYLEQKFKHNTVCMDIKILSILQLFEVTILQHKKSKNVIILLSLSLDIIMKFKHKKLNCFMISRATTKWSSPVEFLWKIKSRFLCVKPQQWRSWKMFLFFACKFI